MKMLNTFLHAPSISSLLIWSNCMEQSPSWEDYNHSASQDTSLPPSPSFNQPEVWLPCSQKPATGPSPELDESSSHFSTLLPYNPIKANVFRLVSSLQVFSTKVCIHFSPMRANAPPITSSLILIILTIFGEVYKLWNSSPPFCHFLLLRPRYSSHTLSVCVLHLVWEAKFHIHTKQHVKL